MSVHEIIIIDICVNIHVATQAEKEGYCLLRSRIIEKTMEVNKEEYGLFEAHIIEYFFVKQ